MLRKMYWSPLEFGGHARYVATGDLALTSRRFTFEIEVYARKRLPGVGVLIPSESKT